MKNLFIPILLATAREGRESEKVANYILEKSQEHGLESEIIDVRNYMLDKTIPPWQELPSPYHEKLSALMTKADGIVIVCPEYNRGYPGEFKIIFDQLFEEYKRKPAGICGVSSGSFGGTRVAEMLKLVVNGVNMVAVPEVLYVSNVDKTFNQEGKLIDKKFNKRADKFLKELIWYAQALKVARNS
jgi:NAD(P)H-dependent FMN reductase